MASIADLPEIERHISALKEISKLIKDTKEELDDSPDINGQILLQLRQTKLSICEKLKVLSSNPGTRAFLIYFSYMLIFRSESTIPAPSAEDLHPPKNASSSLTQIARRPTFGSDFDRHEAYLSSDQMGEAGSPFAGERRVSGPVQQWIPRQSQWSHQFGGDEAVRTQPLAYQLGLGLALQQRGPVIGRHRVSPNSAQVSRHDFDSDVPQQVSGFQAQPFSPAQPASTSDQGSHEAAFVLDTKAHQQVSEFQTQPSSPAQPASTSETANVRHNANQQEIPPANETEPHDSIHLASMSEQGSHKAAKVLHDAAQQEVPVTNKQTESSQSLSVPESNAHDVVKATSQRDGLHAIRMRWRPANRVQPEDSTKPTSPYGDFTYLIDKLLKSNETVSVFFHVLEFLDGSTKIKLSQTSPAMYNIMNCNVIHWSKAGF